MSTAPKDLNSHIPKDLGNKSDTKSHEDEIVISGISGRFPESSNIEEYWSNLINGIDMVNDDPRRWPTGLYGLPSRLGKIKQEDLESCDATFFGIHHALVEQMDPANRVLLALVYEAIVDAGINPQDLRGSRTGVYVGVTGSEAVHYWSEERHTSYEYSVMGCTNSMYANRISFVYDFRGPSTAVDTACSSSLFALNTAFTDLNAGRCDTAIVAGASLVLRAKTTLIFQKFTMLSPDGACKTFDESANGYVRSDGCAAMLLQKAKHARRAYASILNVRTNTDGAKEEGIMCPNGEMHKKLYEDTYQDINLNPHDVFYIEAHGTGTQIGDPQEANGICDFFCKDRKIPLLIGSGKTNMGHSEASSGVCAIAKMVMAMEKGIIPGNLHYKNPNPNINGLVDGRLKVVDKNTEWNGGIIGLTGLGFGGVNVHVVLKSNPKNKNKSMTVSSLPRLAVVSGRTVEAVEVLLKDIQVHADDEEFLALLNEIHTKNIPRHTFRGYTVVGKEEPLCEVIEFIESKRPIWFVYSGMGSQWASMAKELMQIDVFSKSIQRCAKALQPEGVDLIDVLTTMDISQFDILFSFIGITAVQVALTDFLKDLKIIPDGIVGHSFGEVACAYADGCFTAEQAMLASYWRGRSVIDTDLMYGMMASVGLTWEECLKRLPEDVFPACHNSANNVTISGPTESVVKFVETLHEEGIFAQTVNVWDRAFHSKYIEDATLKLRKSLEKVIPVPKDRTKRWVSSSVLDKEWNTPLAKKSSAAYHANNFRSPVYFYEASQRIPQNAICIEIAPHGILQGLLKQNLPKSVTHLSLATRDHEKNLQFLLSNIGKLYGAGAQPAISKLYRPVAFPVSRGTPMLNSKVKWDHSLKWTVPHYGYETSARESVAYFNLNNDEDSYIKGHKVDDRVLFPATGYIALARQQFLKTLPYTTEHLPVILEDIVFHNATIFLADGVVKFDINFLDVVGKFTICSGDTLAASGTIRIPENIHEEELQLDPVPESQSIPLDANDFYKELRLRGYDYSGLFRGVVRVDANGNSGKVLWNGDNWTTFLDTILQASFIAQMTGLRSNLFCVPTHIEKIIINSEKHLKLAEEYETNEEGKVIFPVYIYKDINVLKSGGVQIHGVNVYPVQRRQHNYQDSLKLEKYTFVQLYNNQDLSEELDLAKQHAIESAVLLVVENCNGALKIKTAELLLDKIPEDLLSTAVQRVIEREPASVSDVAIVTSQSSPELQEFTDSANMRIVVQDITKGPIETDCHLYIAADVFTNSNVEVILTNLRASIKEDGFILLEESANSYNLVKPLFSKLNLQIISTQVCSHREYILLRPDFDVSSQNVQVINVTEKNFDWLDELKLALSTAESESKVVYIVCQDEDIFGAVGFMKCIFLEVGGLCAKLFLIQDTNAPVFSLTHPFYMEQMAKNLIINVLNNGVWGTFRHLTLEYKNLPQVHVENAFINTLINGDLSSLKWIEGPPMCNIPELRDPNIELCTVYYAPLNFKDVMISSGHLLTDFLLSNQSFEECQFGLEFCGRDSKGNRIITMVSSKSFATHTLVPKSNLYPVPDFWTLEEASTISIAYCTAYYSLIMRGKIQKGETILIHCGSGAVGQASIRIALAEGLNVLTTVGTPEKREFIKKTFPQLTDRHIGNSRDCSFKQMVMHETKGKGVDVVLNSLAGDKLLESLKCLNGDGRFLDIGKFDASKNNPMGMAVFMTNTSYHGIQLQDVFSQIDVSNEIVRLLKDGIDKGVVQPLPITVFEADQVEEAFRFLASGKHIGKVVIKVREEEAENKLIPEKKLVPAIPRTYMRSDRTYVIIGGLGGFGLELIDWLILKGARNVVAVSRSGIRTGYQSMMVGRWEKAGANVVVSKIDVTTSEGAQDILRVANKMGPVGGIFNSAVVLRDAVIQDQTAEDFRTVCLPKVNATKFLDEASRTLCPQLDYFICFSSAVSARGNVGQANYGLGNSTMERICEARQAAGYPGTAIQWGIVGDTGLGHEILGNSGVGGIVAQKMASCIAILDFILNQPYPIVSSMVLAKKNKIIAGQSLTSCMMNILGIKDISKISKSLTLLELGMDSLMATEIKQTLERNYDIFLSAKDLKQLTLLKLEELENASYKHKLGTKHEEINEYFMQVMLPSQVLVNLSSNADDDKKTPLFVIHSIEGIILDTLRSLVTNLNCPVYGLQCTTDVPLEDIQQMAEFYIEQIKTQQSVGPYNIAGYSFGASVAFEMAWQLEKQFNDVCNIIMLDGSPEYVSSFIEIHLQYTFEKYVENEAKFLAIIAQLMTRMDSFTVYNELQNLSTSEMRHVRLMELVHEATKCSPELISSAINLMTQRMSIGQAYKPSGIIKSNVTLIKCTSVVPKTPEDFGLSRICENTVKVHTVDGDHFSFITGKSAEKVFNILQDIIN